MNPRTNLNIIICVILGMLLLGCSANQYDVYKISGVWRCEVSTPAIKGYEYIDLCPDLNVKITDSLYYRVTDEYIEASVCAIVDREGRWDRRNDSLFISVGRPSITLDKSTFLVNLRQEGVNIESLEALRCSIEDDFFDLAKSEIESMFVTPNYNQPLNLGAITLLDTCTFELKKSNSSIILKKSKSTM